MTDIKEYYMTFLSPSLTWGAGERGGGALRPNMAVHALTPRGSIPVLLVQPAGTGVGSRRLNSLTSHDPILNKIRIHDPLNLVDIAATHFPPFRPLDSAPPPPPPPRPPHLPPSSCLTHRHHTPCDISLVVFAKSKIQSSRRQSYHPRAPF